MREYEIQNSGPSFSVQSLLQLIRAAAAILGVLIMIIGVVYVTRIFAWIFGVLHDPDSFGANLNQWVAAVGGAQLDFVAPGITYHSANMVAIMVLGGGVVILAWISIGLVMVGAKIVSWTLGDREAIKKILADAFGSEKKFIKPVMENHGSKPAG